MHFVTQIKHVLRHFGVWSKCGLRNLPEELVLSPESAKDFKCFHGLFVFALLLKSSFVDT